MDIVVEKSFEGFSEEDKKKGYYRLNYMCPSCNVILGTTTHDAKRCFGRSSVLKNNYLPWFCPDCGETLETSRAKYAEIADCTTK